MKVADLFALLSLKTDKRSFAKTQQVINGVKNQLKRVAVVGGIATAAVGKMISDTAQSADQFAKMSKQVGISVEGLQQLEFAAQISGTGLQVLRTGLQRFARTADDAGQGLKTAQEPFKRLGVTTTDANGNLKPLDELLGDMADKFKAMPDGPEKTALAMKAFGRAGAQLIPLLNEGKDGIGALRKEFTELGGEITSEQAASFEEYNDTIHRVKTALVGLRNQAVIALLPHIKAASKAFLAWVKANRVMLKQNLLKFMRAFAKLIVLVAKGFMLLLKHGEQILVFWISWKVAILAVGVAMKVMAAGGIVAAAKLAAAWVAASLPLILIVALVAAVALAFFELIDTFRGKDTYLRNMFDKIVTKWGEDIERFFRKWEKKLEEAKASAEDFVAYLTGGQTRAERMREENRNQAIRDELRMRIESRQAEARVGATLAEVSGLESVGVLAPGTARRLGGRGPLVDGGGGSMTANITVVTGADPEESGIAVKRALEDVGRELQVAE